MTKPACRRETRDDAAKKDRLYYLSDSPCRICGEEMRYVSTGACVPCTKSRALKRHYAIKELREAARRGE